MKKALVILLIVGLAFAFAAACKPEVKVAELPTGSENYDFSGKTFSYSATSRYIQKTVTSTSGTATTSTVTEIPIRTKTYTIVFDKTLAFTYTVVETFAAGADGTYTNDATTTYVYSTGGSASGHSWSSYAGKTISSTTRTGTWEAVTRKGNELDSITLDYFVAMASEAQVSNTITQNTAATSAYALTSSTTTTTPYASSDVFQLTYEHVGKSSAGKARYYLNDGSGTYISQDVYTLQ